MGINLMELVLVTDKKIACFENRLNVKQTEVHIK
jgi:hypothetical protein